MKIEQQKDFKPVVITLESPDEVAAFWDALEGREPEDDQKQKLINLCNWFSNQASL